MCDPSICSGSEALRRMEVPADVRQERFTSKHMHAYMSDLGESRLVHATRQASIQVCALTASASIEGPACEVQPKHDCQVNVL